MINLYVTKQQLETIHHVLGVEFLKQSQDKQDYSKILDALAMITLAVEKHQAEIN